MFQVSSLRGKSSCLGGVAFVTTNIAVSQHFQLGTVRHDGSRLDIIHEKSHFLMFIRATRPLSRLDDLPPASILPGSHAAPNLTSSAKAPGRPDGS